jgi:hypothetical protein
MNKKFKRTTPKQTQSGHEIFLANQLWKEDMLNQTNLQFLSSPWFICSCTVIQYEWMFWPVALTLTKHRGRGITSQFQVYACHKRTRKLMK